MQVTLPVVQRVGAESSKPDRMLQVASYNIEARIGTAVSFGAHREMATFTLGLFSLRSLNVSLVLILMKYARRLATTSLYNSYEPNKVKAINGIPQRTSEHDHGQSGTI